MLFNSFSFILFFLVVITVYYLPFLKKHQPIVLIIASLYFYSVASAKATLLLLISIAINAAISYLIIKNHYKKNIALCAIGIAINLGMLFFFKYSRLFTTTFVPNTYLDEPVFQLLINIPLPIGISFFTFEGISLLVDTLKKKRSQNDSSKNFNLHFKQTSLFISFFPHLIAGPILKADHFIPQIGTKYFKDIEWEKAIKYLILGYFFKIVIADNLKEQTSYLVYPFDIYHPISLLAMLFGYSIQIFTDFAGYSLIALGLSKLLGYNLIKNFNYPYISKSFSEFWTRWHISLSGWLKEYLYIPLGGNRKGAARTYLNLFIVMFLGGLWHGATWNFAAWGTVHGSALMAERFLGQYFKKVRSVLLDILKVFFVFIVVSFAWLFFKLPTFEEIAAYYQALKPSHWIAYHFGNREFYLLLYTIPILIYYLFYLMGNKNLAFYSKRKKYDPILYGTMLFLIATNAGFSGSFIYFRF